MRFEDLRIIVDNSYGFLLVTKESDFSYMCVLVESILVDGRFVPNMSSITTEKHTCRKVTHIKGGKSKPCAYKWYGHDKDDMIYYDGCLYKFDKAHNDYSLLSTQLKSSNTIKAIVDRLNTNMSLADMIARKEAQFKQLLYYIYGEGLDNVNMNTSFTLDELKSFCSNDKELYNLWLDLKLLYTLEG